MREPDIFFISREHADRIGQQACGVPDLVVEVLSAGTREVDRGEKFAEYAKAGVREYWLVDPDARSIEVFVLRGRVYEVLGKYGVGQRARSELLTGFDVQLDHLIPEGTSG